MVKNIGVHAAHCCLLHGCKYGDKDCPVAIGEVKQVYICETCDETDIKTVEDVHKIFNGEVKTCSHCGNIVGA